MPRTSSLEQRWGPKAKWVVSLSMLAAIIVPSIWMSLQNLTTNKQFLDTVDQSMRNDAMLFAQQMNALSNDLLYNKQLNSVLTGEKSISETEGVAEFPFEISVGAQTVVTAEPGFPVDALSESVEMNNLEPRKLMRGYLQGPDGPMHFVYTLETSDNADLKIRGVCINPKAVQQTILPKAFEMLRDNLRKQRKDNMFPGGMVAIEVQTPDTLLALSKLRPDWALNTGAIDEMSGVFDLGGLFPDWNMRIACYNDAKANKWRRYLGTIFPLLILVLGVFFTSRVAMREMELSRAKTSFVSNVSHELKTPLTKIQFFNELLQRLPEDANEKQSRYHGVIDQECERLSMLVDNVLDFNKIERGQMTYDIHPGPIDDVIQEVVDTFEGIYRAKGYQLNLTISNTIPEIRRDPAALKQAMINLLDNAFKYSDPHTIEIELVQTKMHGKDAVAIRVADQGIGIPEDKLQHVFDEFYRVNTGLSQQVSGSGLGLSIVRHVVDAHGGSVQVQSEPGKGSTFILWLPVKATSA